MSVKHRAATPALVVTAGLVLGGCGGSGQQAAPQTPAGETSSPASATSNQTAGQAEHNRVDVMFLQQMIPHHQQAIEMSDLMLGKSGIDDRVTALAGQIKGAQAPEIEKMSGWLSGWGEPVPSTDGSSMGGMHSSGMGGLDGSGGMMSGQDMAALKAATGADAAKLFLQQMIRHHEGAIHMAEMELASGQNTHVKDLARSITETQQAEVDQMKSLLSSL